MHVLFQCVAEAVMAKGVKGLAELVPGGGYLFDVAQEALKRLKERKRADQLKEEVAQAAAATFEEAKELAGKVAREVAASAPAEDRIALELYLTQLPGAVRQSLRRAEDPSGKTAPANLALNDPADLLRRLPARAARFRPGDPLPGKPGWKLVELLGTGGFGEVWLARNPSLSALKGAVKFGLDPHARDRLLRHEGALVNRVMEQGKHPNVVPLLDAHLEGDAPWLMYEYVPGGDLTGLIYAWQNLPPDERSRRTISALRTLAAAVGHFHRLSPPIVHRDLKPANILLEGVRGEGSGVSKTPSDDSPLTPHPLPLTPPRLKVADFGIGGVAASAALAEAATRRSSTGVLVSQLAGSFTPLYASPQQQNGDPPDPRDDVHALGVIGYQMLTGRLDATVGADYAKTLRKLGVGEPLIELLGDCAAHDPDNRPKDAAELAERLVALAGPVLPKKAGPSVGVRPVAHPVDRLHEPDPPPAELDPEPDRPGGIKGRPRRVVVREEGSRRGRLAGLVLALVIMVCCLGLPAVLFYGVAWLGPSGDTAATAPGRPPLPELVGTAQLRSFTGEKEPIADLIFSPDGLRLAAVHEDGTVEVFDPEAGRSVDVIPTGVRGIRPAFNPDGDWLATAASTKLTEPGHATSVYAWNLRTGIGPLKFDGLTEKPRLIAYSTDGRWLAAADGTDKARVWSLRPDKPNPILLSAEFAGRTHPSGVAGIAFDPKSRYLVTGDVEGEVRVWEPDNTDGWRPQTKLATERGLKALEVSPDGAWVAAGRADGRVRVWKAGVWSEALQETGLGAIARLTMGKAYQSMTILDGSGNAALGRTDGSTWTEIKGHGAVHAIAYRPDGELLATGGRDKTIRLWPVVGIFGEKEVLTGHEAAVRAVAFSPDGGRLASADANGTIIVWGVGKGR